MIIAMKDSVLVFTARTKPDAEKAREVLLDWLGKKKIPSLDGAVSDEKFPEGDLSRIQLGVAIGGDGTFLSLIRRLNPKDPFPLLGVNLGTLGFITEVGAPQMLEAVEGALEKKYPEDRRLLLDVTATDSQGKAVRGQAFNEVAINRDARSEMPRIEVSLSGTLLSCVRADGFLVASPTGSTAYALSAGGPLMHPAVDGVLLVPICAHSLSARPTVVPSTMGITIRLKDFGGVASLVLDGKPLADLRSGNEILVSRAKVSVRLIRPPVDLWAAAIRAKMHMV